jgi:UDP:flavonoid glycosyltransferase YjiC (YdhE family)
MAKEVAMKYLFTTLESDDLGLLARALPLAAELRERGHKIAFCSTKPARRKVIDEAGFENLWPRHPMYYIEGRETLPGVSGPGGSPPRHGISISS